MQISNDQPNKTIAERIVEARRKGAEDIAFERGEFARWNDDGDLCAGCYLTQVAVGLGLNVYEFSPDDIVEGYVFDELKPFDSFLSKRRRSSHDIYEEIVHITDTSRLSPEEIDEWLLFLDIEGMLVEGQS